MTSQSSKNAAQLVLQFSEVKSAQELFQIYNEIKFPSVDESAVALYYAANLPDFDAQTLKLIDKTLDQVDNMDTSVISSVIRALSVLKTKNLHQVSREQIFDIMQYIEDHIKEFDSELLINFCYQAADLTDDDILGQRIATTAISELLEREVKFSKENILSILMIVARFKADCKLNALQEEIHQQIQRFTPGEITQIIWVMSEVN